MHARAHARSLPRMRESYFSSTSHATADLRGTGASSTPSQCSVKFEFVDSQRARERGTCHGHDRRTWISAEDEGCPGAPLEQTLDRRARPGRPAGRADSSQVISARRAAGQLTSLAASRPVGRTAHRARLRARRSWGMSGLGIAAIAAVIAVTAIIAIIAQGGRVRARRPVQPARRTRRRRHPGRGTYIIL